MSMVTVKFVFWIGMLLVFYTFIGYGLLLYLLTIRNRKKLFAALSKEDLPLVTFVIPAYNEDQWIVAKIQNSVQLEYPKNKINFLIVSDGSTDQTKDLINQYKVPVGITLRHYHEPERKGKIAAVERIMSLIETPITIFTDANTMLNKRAIIHLVQHFQNPSVGVVAGEKRVALTEENSGAALGEGFYWKYESFLKSLDAQFYTTIGAAGELFAIRTSLYEPIPKDSIIEDFYMTMSIVAKGYTIAYAPDAYAVETGSVSIREELKRKVRIAAGGFQTLHRLSDLCNPLKYGKLSFQFISRRCFRWIVVPLLLPILFFCNGWLAFQDAPIYPFLFFVQIIFYLLAGIGYLIEKNNGSYKLFTIPYYFCMMHYAMYKGFFRYIRGNQSVLWERAKRA